MYPLVLPTLSVDKYLPPFQPFIHLPFTPNPSPSSNHYFIDEYFHPYVADDAAEYISAQISRASTGPSLSGLIKPLTAPTTSRTSKTTRTSSTQARCPHSGLITYADVVCVQQQVLRESTLATSLISYGPCLPSLIELADPLKSTSCHHPHHAGSRRHYSSSSTTVDSFPSLRIMKGRLGNTLARPQGDSILGKKTAPYHVHSRHLA